MAKRIERGNLMFLVNPAAGRRLAERSLAQVARVLYENGWLVTTFVTAKHGEAPRIVKHYGAQFDRIVCMGGDGTLNEVVSGLLDAGLDVPVGFIPAGSTNDFASTHHLAKDVAEAALDTAVGTVHRIDVAKFNDRYVNFNAAFGPFANVVNTTSQEFKNQLGYLAYIIDGIRDIPATLTPVHGRFEANGKVYEGDYIYGGVCSTLSVGGNIVSLPETVVKPDDGLFEVFLVQMPPDLIELSALAYSLRAGDLNSTYTDFFEAERVTVDSKEDLKWSLDGEPYRGDAHVEIEVLPRRLALVKNEEKALPKA